MGKLLIIVGIICIVVGVFMTYGPKMPFLGKLPGDISVEKENFKFYFPITSSIIVSILISLLMLLINRFKN
ncbi:DUF2905 domain-containing protein [Chryseolinea sp. T2]|uniref:DUF2905 domain-containing protein n=1 Tax=Chryseolinea sp. T2 TaxID=3129255 RepID=UPI003076B5E1